MDDYPDPTTTTFFDESRTNDVVFRQYFDEFLDFLRNSQEMRTTVKSSIKQSLFAGGGALIGSIALGPVGGLVGGIAGSLAGFAQADPYDGVLIKLGTLAKDGMSESITDGETQRQLDENESEAERRSRKQALLNKAVNILQSAGVAAQQFETPAAFGKALVELIKSRPELRNEVWKICVEAVDFDNRS